MLWLRWDTIISDVVSWCHWWFLVLLQHTPSTQVTQLRPQQQPVSKQRLPMVLALLFQSHLVAFFVALVVALKAVLPP